MSTNFFDALGDQLAEFLAPLVNAVEDASKLSALLEVLGSAPDDPAGAPLASTLAAVVDVVNEIETLSANSSPSFTDIAQLLESVKKAVDAVRSLDNPGQVTAGLEGMGKDLIDLLTGLYLANNFPLTYRIAILLTVVDAPADIVPTAPVLAGGNVVRGPVSLPRFHPDRLIALIKDPVALLKSQYLTPLATDADANAMADKLFPRVSGLLRLFEVLCKYGITPEEIPLLGDGAPYVDHTLTVWIAEEVLGATEDAGLAFSLSPATRGDLGLVISPFGGLQFTTQDGDWTFETAFTAEVDALAIGRRGTVIAASGDTISVDAKFSATLAAPDSGPAYILGTPTGTRLEIGGASFVTELAVKDGNFLWSIAANVSSSDIVLSAGDGDGFLQSVLPSNGLSAKFDLGLTWSNTAGLAFRGAGSLDAALSIGISLGGVVKIPTLYLGIGADSSTGISAEVSLAASVNIGPVAALIDHVGLLATFTFPSSGGNLGLADFAFAFKPPSGVGLAIDSGGVSGGGFLAFDTTKHEYSGVLQLEFDQITLQAFGLITTQVAGGDGYSLLALIDANFPPVQLGWGFTLNGVGGLLAVHRSASVDALRAALKADTLGKILFPKNAITSASQVLSELDTLFPTAPGRFLFGPMALIGWGSPTILTAAVAVIVELPEPVRIVLIARLSALLPTPSSALIKLNMDALGVLDLGQGQFSLDATLFDSRLLSFTLTGDMALRANWGTEREFLLAIGGFHPKFTPPADFPALQRLTINMPSGKIGKMRLMAYLAITSNTVQFGAELDVALGVAGCGLAGNLSFDALLQLDPFHFEADISGKVAITVDGDDLASIGLDATLTGPAPWNIAGKFTFHILWWDVSKSFSETWGEDAPAQPVAPVDVAGLLKTALADPRSWSASLPAGTPTLASIRPGADAGTVLAHPWAQLEVSQRIVPLNLDITRFGQAPPLDATRFALTDLRVGGGASAPTSEAVEDDFAPAQFFDLSDEEKLARPSFERHDAGLRLTADLIDTGTVQTKTLAYETSFVDEPGGAPRPDPSVPVQSLSWIDTLYVLEKGAAGRAGITRAGNRRYTAPGQPVQVAEPAFVIVETDTLAPAGIGPVSGLAYSHVQALLDAQPAAQRGSLQIVATHELEAAA